MKKMSLIFLFFLVVSLFSQQKFAEVTYVSGTLVYLNVGKDVGIAPKDTLSILREEKIIGKIVVENVSKKASSGIYIPIFEEVKVGDKADLSLVKIPTQPLINIKEAPKEIFPKLSTENEREERRRKLTPKFRGRYLVQAFDNRDVDNKDFTNQRFTNSLKFAVSNAFLPSLDFNFYVNHTYLKRNSTIAKNENYYNLYQAEVLYKNPGIPFYFAFGRTYSLGSASAGNLNGGEFGYKFSENLKGGIYGGKESATENNKLLGDGNKFGTYLVYQKQNYNSTLSFNQKNVSGKVDEQFLTFQNFFSSGRKFSFNQSGDLYLKNNNESKIQLRRIFVSTNYEFLENWRFSANYNAYKNIKVDETSMIPDSLFNDRFSQTIGLRTSYNSAWKTDFAFGLTSRFSQGITHPVLGVNFDVNFRERLGMDFLRTSVNYYNSATSNTVRTRVSAEKTLFENFTTEVEFGNYFYAPTSGKSDFNSLAGGIFSYYFGRFYSDLSVEYDFGSTNYFQTVLAIGINF